MTSLSGCWKTDLIIHHTTFVMKSFLTTNCRQSRIQDTVVIIQGFVLYMLYLCRAHRSRKITGVNNQIIDGWIPYNWFSFQVLSNVHAGSKPHCHGLLGHLNGSEAKRWLCSSFLLSFSSLFSCSICNF